MTSFSEKITELRQLKGLTQEDLADRTGLNLRTIQRIEKGQSIPRGHTLRVIAKTLDKPVDYFLETRTKEATNTLHIMNISALAFIVFPFLNILLPFIIWNRKKDIIDGIDKVGRRILNFQILWTVATYTLFITVLIGQVLGKYYFDLLPGPVMLYLFFISYLINILMIIHATFQLKKGRQEIYHPFVLQFI